MSSASDDVEIDLLQLWGLMLDSRKLIATAVLVTSLLGISYLIFATPVYRADALLQVEDKQGGVPGLGELSELFTQESSGQTEIELVRSRMVLGQVVTQLGLDISIDRYGFGWGNGEPITETLPLFAAYSDANAAVVVEHLTVPELFLGEPLVLSVEPDRTFSLTYDGQLLLAGRGTDRAVSGDGRFVLKLSGLEVASAAKYELVKRHLLSVVADMEEQLSVGEQGKGTGILRLSYKGSSIPRIQAILNAITESYLLQNVKRMSEQAENSIEFLDKQLPEMRQKLQISEDKLNEFRLKSESVDLSLETKAVLDRLVVIEGQLNELQFKESELSRLYTKEHPAYQTLVQQRESLREEARKLNDKIKSLPETQQEILSLTRDVQVAQEIYVQMLNKVQELRIVKAGTVGNVRIIDSALVDPRPVAPKKALVLAISILLGLMGGVGWVLLRAAFHRGIKSPDELEQEGLPVYATIPMSEVQSRISFTLSRSKGRRKDVPLLALEDPADLALESLRSLRTSLHFAMLEAKNPVLMITGPSPGIGKSFVAANLAVVLAQINSRVALVDADMRRGRLHEHFKGDKNRGLSNLLAGQVSLEDVLQPTQVSNLDFISRGELPPNPAELLMNSRFSELLDELSSRYDLVIIDTPPVLAVTDPAIVGQRAGTSLLVTRFEKNSVKEVMYAVQRLEQNQVPVRGVLLNCIEKRALSNYAYSYSYKSDNPRENND